MKPTPARSPEEAIDLTFAQHLMQSVGLHADRLEPLAGGETSRAYRFESTGEQDLNNRRAPEHIGEKQGTSLEARRTDRGKLDPDR